MTPETTKYVIETIEKINNLLDETVFHVKSNETPETLAAYRAIVGEMLELSLTKLINPLCRQHPNLKPEDLFLPESYMKKPDTSGL